MYKKLKAFTLAEVLITLLIIGVVASLVIPSLLQDTSNAEMIVAAKKALASANQAYKLAIVDNGDGFGKYNTFQTATGYSKFNALKAKLSVIKDCPFNSGSFGNCWSAKGVGSGTAGTDCPKWAVNTQNYNPSFVTSDGMFWMLYTYNSTASIDWMAVDVNGAKGPNDWAKDVFIFILDDRTIRPFDYNCNGFLKHNNGTTVDTVNEFRTVFK